MATIEVVEGFEHATALTTNGGGLCFAKNGTAMSIQSSIKRSGDYALKMTSSGVVQYITITNISGINKVVSLGIYFETLPSVDFDLAMFRPNGGTDNGLWYSQADNKFMVKFVGEDSSTAIKSSMTINTGQWYQVDMYLGISGTTYTTQWKIDGITQTTDTWTGTVYPVTAFQLGWANVATTATVYYDDYLNSDYAVDYPLGQVFVLKRSPSADGTPTNPGTDTMEAQDGTDIGVTTGYDKVNSLPMSDMTYYIKQSIADNTKYARINFETGTLAYPIGGNVLLAYQSSTATANTGASTIGTSGVSTTLYGSQASPLDYSETSMFYKRRAVPASPGWTKTVANTIYSRVGYSTNVTSSIPYWVNLFVQIAYAITPTKSSTSAYLSGPIQSGASFTSAYTSGFSTGNNVNNSNVAFSAGSSVTANSIRSYLNGISSFSTLNAAYLEGGSTPTETLHPSSDIATNSWVNESNGSSLYPSLADTSDDTYAWKAVPGIGEYFEVGLEGPTGTPTAGTHTITWRMHHLTSDNGVTLKFELRQGETIIASDTRYATNNIFEYTKTLTAGEIANITDYSALKVRVTIMETPKYYVDATGGNNSNTGLSPDQAWQTIAKVNSFTPDPGTEILFKRGETWTDTYLDIDTDGLEGLPIIYADYGTGALPIIDVSGATNNQAINIDTQQYVVVRNLHGKNSTATGQYTFRVYNSKYVYIYGCDLEGSYAGAMFLSGTYLNCHHIWVQYCKMHGCLKHGMLTYESTLSVGGPSYLQVDHNESYSNGAIVYTDHGFYFTRPMYSDISYNIAHDNFSAGIKMNNNAVHWYCYSNVHHNYCYDNGDYGIYAGAHSCNYYDNLLVHNKRGISFDSDTENSNFYHNTIVNSTLYGVYASAVSTGNVFKNNLVYMDYVLYGGNYVLYFATDVPALAVTFDNNLYFSNEVTQCFYVGGQISFASWKALSNTPDANGVNSNPVFVNAASDFHIQTTSPAKNAGATGLGITTDYDDVTRDASPDIGAYEFV